MAVSARLGAIQNSEKHGKFVWFCHITKDGTRVRWESKQEGREGVTSLPLSWAHAPQVALPFHCSARGLQNVAHMKTCASVDSGATKELGQVGEFASTEPMKNEDLGLRCFL